MGLGESSRIVDRAGVDVAADHLCVGVGFLSLALETEACVERPELFVPLEGGAAGSRLRLSAGSPVRLDSATFEGLDGSRRPLTLSPMGTGGFEATDLPETAGCVVLQFEEGEGKGKEEEAIPHPIDIGRSALPDSAPPAGQPATGAAPSDLPDIVILIPDAARADHFGCYGYPRATTPNIDQLASEGWVFSHANASASYTLASVPSMLTGLSFLDHRVERRGDRLDEKVATLADRLQTVGYATLAYTANPNNSHSTGTDQGFEEFETFWEGVTPKQSRDAFRLADRASERLANGFDGRPMLMLVHVVPPHEPYDPAPVFDRFGDPDYRGDYDGSLRTMRKIESGELRPTPADMARVVSLYDGNLRAADAALGRILDALRARPRWDRTVVLVVSDHGEAFGEHGRMGHNSTVHVEMLRVPFVLRVPPSLTTASPEIDRLVRLEDIVPTLLPLAGLTAGSELSGIDLLNPPDHAKHRSSVARSAQERPIYAYVTSGHKLIWGSGRAALYDTAVDPGEQDDLASERPRTLACMERLLALRLSRSGRSLGGAARQPDDDVDPLEVLDEEEIESLRSLGYVN